MMLLLKAFVTAAIFAYLFYRENHKEEYKADNLA